MVHIKEEKKENSVTLNSNLKEFKSQRSSVGDVHCIKCRRISWLKIQSISSASSPVKHKVSSIRYFDNLLLLAFTEAAAYGKDENESLEAKAQKALECPCIADLRNGQCGVQFSEAFLCFLKSTSEEKGSDCVHPFVALQNCIKANPTAFSKDVLEEEDVKKGEAPAQEYKIIPPIWSQESPRPKSKL